MGKKLDYEQVKNLFKINGCVLLEKTYKNNKHPMRYLCKCGREAEICYSSFKNGRKCITCGGRKRHDYEYVESYFVAQGCQLLSNNYRNAHEDLEYICSCGTYDVKNFCNFKNGQRCKNCKKIKMSKENHWAWQSNRENKKNYDIFKKRCYEMVSRSLRVIRQNKNNRSYILLGYTAKELQEHIINHPKWVVCKNSSWEIDHIFPIKAFIDHQITDLSLINHLSNLQPLTKKDNLSKSDNYNEEDFQRWLEKIKSIPRKTLNLKWQVRNTCNQKLLLNPRK